MSGQRTSLRLTWRCVFCKHEQHTYPAVGTSPDANRDMPMCEKCFSPMASIAVEARA